MFRSASLTCFRHNTLSQKMRTREPLLNLLTFERLGVASLPPRQTNRESQTIRQNEKASKKLSLLKKGVKNNRTQQSSLTIHRLLERQSRRNLNVGNQRKVRVTLLNIKNPLSAFTNLFVVTSSYRHRS
jgi:hypothetical protein